MANKKTGAADAALYDAAAVSALIARRTVDEKVAAVRRRKAVRPDEETVASLRHLIYAVKEGDV